MSQGHDVGDDSGPCPRCKGPTKVVSYDEAPWGVRGHYSYSCEKCGEFGFEFRDAVDDPRPAQWVFMTDATPPAPDEVAQGRAAGKSASFLELIVRPITGFKPGVIATEFARRGAVNMVVLEEQAVRGALNYKDDSVIVVESVPVKFEKAVEDPVLVEIPRRCHRCGRLESICDSGLYGDCVDYRRQ